MKWQLCCFFIFLIAFGCISKGSKPDPVATTSFITAPLEVTHGYLTNRVTGDPVKPIVNESGDTIRTGVSMAIEGRSIGQVKPRVLKAGRGRSEPLVTNVHLLSGNIIEKSPDPALLSSKNYDPATTVSIDIHPRKIDFKQPSPVKVLPLRFKDNALYNIQYLDVEQGLGSSYVYAVLQDSRGRLWFGTDGAGVDLYDGQYLIPYTEQQGLTNNVVSVIFEDSKGNIWLGTQHGITIYDGKSFYQVTREMGLLSDEILDIMEDRQGMIWMASTGGVYRFNGNTLSILTVKDGLPSDNVRKIMEDETGKLWFATDRGVSVFDGHVFVNYHEADGLTSDGIYSLIKARNGIMWFGSSKGICSFDGKKFRHFNKSNGLVSDNVWSILEDEDENIWVSTYGGISMFNGKAFTNYTRDEGLSNNGVRQLLKDNNGNIWCGTDGGGVNKLRTSSFVHMADRFLTGRKIRSVLQDHRGILWFGSDGNGVTKLIDSTVTNYSFDDGLGSWGARTIVEDKNGNIWFGFDGQGFSKYDGSSFSNYIFPGTTGMNIIRSMTEDVHGNLWFGTYGGGLVRFDGQQFLVFTEKEGLSCNKIIALLIDHRGNLWIGSESGGLSRYDGKSITHFSEKNGLPGNKIFSLAEDNNGNIWIGTSGGGVCRFDGRNFSYLTENDGLTNNNVWSIKEDHRGRLWFGTDNGLNLAVPKANRYVIYNYGVEDGLKSADFNLKTVWEDDQHRMWWGTGKSVTNLDLEEFRLPEDSLSLQLSFLEINGIEHDFRSEARLKGNISYTEVPAFSRYPLGLKLPYDQNHLVFHFAAANWQSPHQIRYSYRLKGLDQKWSLPSANAMAEYRNLGYGDYVFEVRAICRTGRWTEPKTYSFRILPAWWQTWWFRGLEMLLLVGFVLLISRYIYKNKLRRQREILERQLAVQYERQRISAEMHDDIGAGLSGVRLMAEMASNKIRDEKERNEVIRIYQSLGSISARMKEVIWSLNVENDDLASLISFIQKQARQLMEAYPCELNISLPERIPDIEIDGESRRNIYLLVKECLHNIIRHSGADKVDISITCNSELVIIIRDNGKGFEYPSDVRTGNGMKNMKNRIEAVNGEMLVNADHGTTIKLNIPLKQFI